jgi:hypothetical protein
MVSPMPQQIPAPERFQTYYEINSATGCWEWTLCLNQGGYGVFHTNNKQWKAHRFAYQILIGPIPEGLTLDHLCKNKKCVNPEHLEPVTQYVNTVRGKGSSSLYCSKGHAMFGEHLYFNDGNRRCQKCKRIADLNSKRRKRERGKRSKGK